jgi:hypothetical protein
MEAPGAFHPDCISRSTTCSLKQLRPSESTAHLVGSDAEAAFHSLMPVASLYLMYRAGVTWAGVSPKSFGITTPSGTGGGPPPSPPPSPSSPPPAFPPGTCSTAAVALRVDPELVLDMIVDRGKNKNSISKFLLFRRVDNSYKRSAEEA